MSKLSDLTPEQQIEVLKELCILLKDAWWGRIIVEAIDKRVEEHTLINNHDRLINRLYGDFIMTDIGIAAHDNEALEWLKKVLEE